jgi:TnpA family transposase
MSVHELLSPAQREVLTAVPTPLGARLLARYYTFSREDLLQIRAHRKPANRLGFGVQLCYLRFPGRALAPDEAPPADLLAHVAAQLRLDPAVFANYAQRDQTRREHLVELGRRFGFRSFTRRDYMDLARELLSLAHSTEHGLALVTALVEACRARRIILPAILTLERLAWGVRRRAQQHVYQVLLDPLTATQRRQLQTLLVVLAAGGLIPLTWLRQPPGAPKPTPFKRVVARLMLIRALSLPPLTSGQVHPNRLLQLAREGARLSPQRLRNLPADQRDATLVAFLHHQATELTDQALAIHDQIFAKLLGRGAHQQGAAAQQDGRAINEKVVLYARVGRALIRAKDADQDAYQAITTVLPWERFVETVDEAEKLARPEEFDFLELLDTHYSYLREYTPLLLATFEFKAAPSHRVLLAALAVIKELDATGKRKLPASVPLAFVPPRWEKLVSRQAGLDRHYYEMCALAELRDGLRTGDVWVAGRRRFKDLQDYLLPAATWQELRADGVLPLLGGELNVRRLGEQWDGVLRLATSIWQGTVTASLILSKLAAYPRQNSLAWALREQGRLEKTLWVLEWLQDPLLLRRVLAGLNKGEARHSLARGVCLHRRGAIYDLEFEAQYLRASGLNLLVAAIITWNTVYLADAVDQLRARGVEISDAQLQHLSPLGWEHINLTGDYRWNMQLITGLDQRRPLRRLPPS